MADKKSTSMVPKPLARLGMLIMFLAVLPTAMLDLANFVAPYVPALLVAGVLALVLFVVSRLRQRR